MDKVEKGYVCQFSIPESCNPSWTDISNLAQITGFEEQYLPRPKSARSAWENATSLPKRGEKVTPNFFKRRQAMAEHGVEPIVKIRHEVVSDSAPVLRRALVQYVYIPNAQKDDGKDGTKQKYLHIKKLAMLEFDTESESTHGYIFNEPDSWVDKQELQNLVTHLKQRWENMKDTCIANDIRAGLRNFLDDMHRIKLVKNWSGYYIPDRPGAGEKLKAFREFIRGMAAFSPIDPPLAYVFKVAPDDEDGLEDLKSATIEQLSSQLFELQGQAQRFIQLDDKKTQKKVDSLLDSLLAVQTTANVLRQSIDDDLAVLDVLFDAAKRCVLEAQSTVEA